MDNPIEDMRQHKRFVIICKPHELKRELAFRWRDIGPKYELSYQERFIKVRSN